MEFVLSYLNNQKQWNSADDVQHVVDDLNKNNNSVTTFHLTGNTMGIKAAERLTEPLSKQTKIEKLLWSDLFTGRGKDEIGIALKALSLGLMSAKVQLVELDLSDNAFGPNGVVGVTELIASPCCYTLKVLNMNNQGLGHQGCRALVKAMKTARENSNKKGLNLEVFIAGRNRLENEGMEMLSEVFGDGMNSLKKLVLLQNGIGLYKIKGVESLIVAIRNHKDLKILNISDNNIKSIGMQLLSDVLPEFESLEELYMDDCLLGKKGANIFSLIAEDRSICPSLKIISLTGNELKNDGAQTIVNAIVEGKPSIEKIDLRENEIKKSGIIAIKKLLDQFNKGDILVDEDELSDEENDDEDSDALESEEDNDNGSVSSGQVSDNNSENNEDSSEELSKNPINKSGNSTENGSTKNTFDTGLFSTANKNINPFASVKQNESIFGNTFKDPQRGLFGAPTSSDLFGNKTLFTAPTTTASPFTTTQLKATPETGGLFSVHPTSSIQKSAGLFSANIQGTNLFSTPVKERGLFDNVTAAVPGSFSDSPRTNIFATPIKQGNIFTKEQISFIQKENTEKPLFSFSLAAKSDTSLKDAIMSALRSESVMTVDKAVLDVAKDSNSKVTLDRDLLASMDGSPEIAVRVALILCQESKTFDLGVSMVGYLLTSRETWPQSTNAVLVEMDCIKSEEKRFIPLCHSNPDVPIRVLKKILSTEQLPKEVNENLSTVLRNLTKSSTSDSEDLLRQLDDCMSHLSI